MRRSFYTVAVLVGLCATARAEEAVLEIGAGATLPVSSADWRKSVEPSPAVALRMGAGGGDDGDLTGLVELAYIPERLDATGVTFPAAGTARSLARIRALAELQITRRLDPSYYNSVRVGAGVDILRARWDLVDAVGAQVTRQVTDYGLAFDAADTLWLAGSHGAIGVEASVLFGRHTHPRGAMQLTDPSFGYFQVDLMLSLVARFAAR